MEVVNRLVGSQRFSGEHIGGISGGQDCLAEEGSKGTRSRTELWLLLLESD